jgi:uridylate kinase
MNPNSHRRVLLKISGEVLMGSGAYGIELATISRLAQEITEAAKLGYQIALVIGGGNIFRGLSNAAKGMDRILADHMGMMATIMNALAVQSVLQASGTDCRVLSSIAMPSICETFSHHLGRRYLDEGKIIICAGGTGLPLFTTDTGAALRAAELRCDALLKGTSVDGVYDADPKTNPSAKRFETITYDDALRMGLRFMDHSAIGLARDSEIPVIVFSIRDAGNIPKVIAGQGKFSTVKGN